MRYIIIAAAFLSASCFLFTPQAPEASFPPSIGSFKRASVPNGFRSTSGAAPSENFNSYYTPADNERRSIVFNVAKYDSESDAIKDFDAKRQLAAKAEWVELLPDGDSRYVRMTSGFEATTIESRIGRFVFEIRADRRQDAVGFERSLPYEPWGVSKPESFKDVPEPSFVNITEITKRFYANPKLGLFINARVSVTGKVDEQDVTGVDPILVFYDPGKGLTGSIRAFFDPDQKEKVKKVKKGDTVKFTCYTKVISQANEIMFEKCQML